MAIDITIRLHQTSPVTKRRSRERLNLCTQVQRAFGARLQKVRTEKGILQKNLATALGITRTSVSNIERGITRVTLDQLYIAARVLKVDVAELLPPTSEVHTFHRIHTASDDPLPATAADAVREVIRTLSEDNIQRLIKRMS